MIELSDLGKRKKAAEAAALDLFDALQEAQSLVMAWAIHYQGTHSLSEWHPVHKAIYDKTIAALAKAQP